MKESNDTDQSELNIDVYNADNTKTDTIDDTQNITQENVDCNKIDPMNLNDTVVDSANSVDVNYENDINICDIQESDNILNESFINKNDILINPNVLIDSSSRGSSAEFPATPPNTATYMNADDLHSFPSILQEKLSADNENKVLVPCTSYEKYNENIEETKIDTVNIDTENYEKPLDPQTPEVSEGKIKENNEASTDQNTIVSEPLIEKNEEEKCDIENNETSSIDQVQSSVENVLHKSSSEIYNTKDENINISSSHENLGNISESSSKSSKYFEEMRSKTLPRSLGSKRSTRDHAPLLGNIGRRESEYLNRKLKDIYITDKAKAATSKFISFSGGILGSFDSELRTRIAATGVSFNPFMGASNTKKEYSVSEKTNDPHIESSETNSAKNIPFKPVKTSTSLDWDQKLSSGTISRLLRTSAVPEAAISRLSRDLNSRVEKEEMEKGLRRQSATEIENRSIDSDLRSSNLLSDIKSGSSEYVDKITNDIPDETHKNNFNSMSLDDTNNFDTDKNLDGVSTGANECLIKDSSVDEVFKTSFDLENNNDTLNTDSSSFSLTNKRSSFSNSDYTFVSSLSSTDELEEEESRRRVREYIASLSARLEKIPDHSDSIETYIPPPDLFPTTPEYTKPLDFGNNSIDTPPSSADNVFHNGPNALSNRHPSTPSSTEPTVGTPGTRPSLSSMNECSPAGSSSFFNMTPPSSAIVQSTGYFNTPPNSIDLTSSFDQGSSQGSGILKRAMSCDSVSSDTSITLGELEEQFGQVTGHLTVELIYDR